MNVATATPVDAPDHLFGVDEDRRESNAARAADRGLEPCTHCGRGVKEGAGWMVEVVDGGGSLAVPGTADTSDPGYMGCWVLGSTCAKGVPASHRVRWNGWSATGVE